MSLARAAGSEHTPRPGHCDRLPILRTPNRVTPVTATKLVTLGFGGTGTRVGFSRRVLAVHPRLDRRARPDHLHVGVGDLLGMAGAESRGAHSGPARPHARRR